MSKKPSDKSKQLRNEVFQFLKRIEGAGSLESSDYLEALETVCYAINEGSLSSYDISQVRNALYDPIRHKRLAKKQVSNQISPEEVREFNALSNLVTSDIKEKLSNGSLREVKEQLYERCSQLTATYTVTSSVKKGSDDE